MIWAKPEIKSFGEDQLLKELQVQAYHSDAFTNTNTHTDSHGNS